ncbi:MAG: transposase [Planctomycetota bacterium]
MGFPRSSQRLTVTCSLSYILNESDDTVVARWVENPYWQSFCGYTHLQHECPIHPSSMSRWRKRVGVDRLEGLLKETVALAVREKHVSQRDLERGQRGHHRTGEEHHPPDGFEAAARQPVRRTYALGNLDCRTKCHRHGTYGRLCGQGVSRTKAMPEQRTCTSPVNESAAWGTHDKAVNTVLGKRDRLPQCRVRSGVAADGVVP